MFEDGTKTLSAFGILLKSYNFIKLPSIQKPKHYDNYLQ